MENESYLDRLNKLISSEFNNNDAEFARFFKISRQSVYNARRKEDLNLTFRQILDAIDLGKKIYKNNLP